MLAKGAEDIKSGAGQYFTPRATDSTRWSTCILPTAARHRHRSRLRHRRLPARRPRATLAEGPRSRPRRSGTVCAIASCAAWSSSTARPAWPR
ncbi:MAG: hypothetical protein WKF47_13930 [Geodermatophilaceae bacterium]